MRVVSDLVPTADETATLGRRERKKAETRRAIRDAALELALEVGVDCVTVARISEAADVAPRTFFNYFSCKEDALVTDGTDAASHLREAIAARPHDEAPIDSLRAAVIDSVLVTGIEAGREQMLRRQRLIQADLGLMTRQLAQFATVERAFAEALAERMDADPDHDLLPAMLAAVTIGVVRVAIRRWSTDGSEPLVCVISRAFDLLDDGALTDPPR